MPDNEKPLSSRLAPVLAVIAVLVLGSLFPKGDVTSTGSRVARTAVAERKHDERRGAREKGRHKENKDVNLAAAIGGGDGTVDLAAYEDLGSWIDIYDSWPWAHPTLAVRKLHARGVRAIFLQTSNYGAKEPIFKPRQTTKFLKAAHQRDMKVVAWSVPSFDHPQVDYHRARAAVLFKRAGHRFDSFGLDIEATVVGNIYRRNRRLLELSKRLRALVGPDYPLGAITPDPVKALYWPDFPYKRVNHLYDVFVPMGYFSFRADGYKDVKKYTLASIRNIRRESGNPDVPIHLIGGIGGETQVPEVKGFVRAVRANDVLGASYYDFSVTSDDEWEQLETIVDDPEPAPTPQATPAVVPEVRPTSLTTPEPAKESAPKKSKGKGSKQKKKRDEGERSKKRSRGKDDRRRDRDRRDRDRRDRKR